MAKFKDEWSAGYISLVERNIGFLTVDEQNRLKHSKVSIFGVGGLGGIVLEILARSGIEHFSIVDNDIYESSNLNRQIFAFDDTLGRMKIEVGENFCKKINPEMTIEVFDRVEEGNCSEILAGSGVSALVLDDVKACLTIARTARSMKITFVEGWALPFANVCTFTPETPSFEETYGLAEIENIPVSAIPDGKKKLLLTQVLFSFRYAEGIADYYSDEALRSFANGITPSFAPTVWFTAARIAIECIKVLLGWKDLALSPNFSIYDPFSHKIPKRLDRMPQDREDTIRQILFGRPK
jgi:molybdopterin/thiamine biosynthesis adenylyltransferase